MSWPLWYVPQHVLKQRESISMEFDKHFRSLHEALHDAYDIRSVQELIKRFRSLHEELSDVYDIRSVQEMLGTYDTCDMRATLMHVAAFSNCIPAEKVGCLVAAGYSVDLPGKNCFSPTCVFL